MILSIELSDLQLQFQVLDTPVAELWLERMQLRDQYPLDNPTRFYGFNTQEQEERIALEKIQKTCAAINQWQPIIERSITSVDDQDTLNYLHNIFERYHGLLDTQPEDVPAEIRQHLADLNINVHRCESVARGARPRFVCTWYGLPKTETLPVDLIQEYGTLNPKFGSVCLNYAEIGKTLEDLTQDNDRYIGDEAFRPFSHYSADFNVRFYEETAEYVADKCVRMQRYFNQHIDFFHNRGYNRYNDPCLLPVRFPVAELIETKPREQLLKEIQQRQQITKVEICHTVK